MATKLICIKSIICPTCAAIQSEKRKYFTKGKEYTRSIANTLRTDIGTNYYCSEKFIKQNFKLKTKE